MTLSIVFPCRNAGEMAFKTVRNYVKMADNPSSLQFCIVEDGSDRDRIDLVLLEKLGKELNIQIRFKRQKWGGVAKARNAVAKLATNAFILMTDCHTCPSKGYDTEILSVAEKDSILALTICDTESSFKGYGCKLIVPFMGTNWNRKNPGHLSKVDIASSAGTVISSKLFKSIKGYDEGMRVYGAIEPELSVRAWMHGSVVQSLPSVEIYHEFKNKDEVNNFISQNRINMVHNSLRFGICYLDDERIFQMLRYYSLQFPEIIDDALTMIEKSDVWKRKKKLEKKRKYSFHWFCQKRRVRDHSGAPTWQELDVNYSHFST